MNEWLGSVFLLVAFGVASSTHGQDISSNQAAKLNQALSQSIPNDTGGCGVGIWSGEALVFSGAKGYANVEHKVPITANTVFDIASISKQFTASAILLLSQQGKISLQDNIRKYIPEMPKYEKEILIKDLLNHTSGIRNFTSLLELEGIGFSQPISKADILALIARQTDVEFPSGESFKYTNSGYFLAAMIIERVTGLSLGQFTKRHIFDSLSMTNTRFLEEHDTIISDRADAYSKTINFYRKNTPKLNMAGPGGLLTSINDISKWNKNFSSGKVGGKKLIKLLEKKGQLNSGMLIPYGYGIWVLGDGDDVSYEHNGAWGGYRSVYSRSPSSGMSIAIFCNIDDVDIYSLLQELKSIALHSEHIVSSELAELSKIKELSKQIMDFTRKAGVYELDGIEKILFFEDGGRFFLVSYQLGMEEIFPLQDNVFHIPNRGIKINFLNGFDESHSLARWIWPSGDETALYKKTEVKLTDEEVLNFAGDFFSKDMLFTYKFVSENGQLYAIHPKLPKVHLIPIGQGRFLGNKQHLLSMEGRNISRDTTEIRINAFDLQELVFEKVD
ncbi:hypothetical protein GCM10009092_21490 [Bowmanella denitrificans]|uniref:Beta-lactamase-related domain-containing protein n=1 Tax=Bowmanella denitrificans TaxID=366582 RepID=A0ABN0X7C0_9ALTE